MKKRPKQDINIATFKKLTFTGPDFKDEFTMTVAHSLMRSVSTLDVGPQSSQPDGSPDALGMKLKARLGGGKAVTI